MKTQRNIFIAFLLNLLFSAFEVVGGLLTGSVAIVSDAVHDLGDAAGIGISWLLEKKSKKQSDENYTYGYARYSVAGSLITNLILLAGSLAVIANAVGRLITPMPIRYNGMIVFAVVGVCVNFCAAYFTREGDSLNQKAVNLHMIEDVLGWAVVLVGAVVMKFTHLLWLDPLMSMGVSLFILVNALGNLKEVGVVFLERAPRHVEVAEIKKHISQIHGVEDVHHIHLWSMDGMSHCATMHLVTNADPARIKAAVRQELREHGIGHVTIELETSDEDCPQRHCQVEHQAHTGHCHHHHTHH